MKKMKKNSNKRPSYMDREKPSKRETASRTTGYYRSDSAVQLYKAISSLTR
jgi:hypothetical protein